MSGHVLLNFRLDRAHPIRVRWLAKDGAPREGYKAQITCIVTAHGRLPMDHTAIVETTARDGERYVVTFSGMVGYPEGHRDRPVVDKVTDGDVAYELGFFRADGSAAVAGEHFAIEDAPPAHVHRVDKAAS
jgi:hypothetical protein